MTDTPGLLCQAQEHAKSALPPLIAEVVLGRMKLLESTPPTDNRYANQARWERRVALARAVLSLPTPTRTATPAAPDTVSREELATSVLDTIDIQPDVADFLVHRLSALYTIQRRETS
jgi:hypothetical protein